MDVKSYVTSSPGRRVTYLTFKDKSEVYEDRFGIRQLTYLWFCGYFEAFMIGSYRILSKILIFARS